MINNVDSTNDGGDEQTYNKTNDSPTQCGVNIELRQYITHKTLQSDTATTLTL